MSLNDFLKQIRKMKVTLKLELSSLKSSETKYTTAWLFFLNHFLFFCLQLSSTLLSLKILIRIVVVEPVEIVENF